MSRGHRKEDVMCQRAVGGLHLCWFLAGQAENK